MFRSSLAPYAQRQECAAAAIKIFLSGPPTAQFNGSAALIL